MDGYFKYIHRSTALRYDIDIIVNLRERIIDEVTNELMK